MANKNLTVLLIDELDALFLVEDLSDIAIPSLWIFSHSVNPIFLAHFGLVLCIFGDLEFLESESNGLAGHFGHHIYPITLDRHSQFLTFLQLLLRSEN
jgi:hypothetical protein